MSTTTNAQWAPCLMLEHSIYPERLPGLYDTHAQAMAVAEVAAHQRPDAVGISAKRVEVHQ